MYDQLYVVLPPVYASQVRFLFAMKTMVNKDQLDSLAAEIKED